MVNVLPKLLTFYENLIPVSHFLFQTGDKSNHGREREAARVKKETSLTSKNT